MSEQGELGEPAAETLPAPPGPSIKQAVIEVLEELGITGQPAPEPAATTKPRSLRQEEADMENLVTKVLDKLEARQPPEPKTPQVAEPEVAPGPPPRKRRIQSAMWG
jgi:hypothetical protein